MHATRYLPLLLVLAGAAGFLAFHQLGKEREPMAHAGSSPSAAREVTASAGVEPTRAIGPASPVQADQPRQPAIPKDPAVVSAPPASPSSAPAVSTASYPDRVEAQADQSAAIEHPEVTDPKMRQLLQPAWAD